MSVHNESDFDRLFAAHCNRELEPGEFEQLQVLAGADEERAQAVQEVETMHRLFASERALFAAAAAPLEPRDEADEVYRGLCRRAAQAEETLRASATAGTAPVSRARLLSAPRGWVAAAAAAFLVVAAYALGVFTPAEPEDLRLRGIPRIQLEPEITRASPQISWHTVVGARTYDAVIVDAENRAILVRPDHASRSTAWQLTPDEFARLESAAGAVFLRVVALDGSGLELATTGDLQLNIR